MSRRTRRASLIGTAAAAAAISTALLTGGPAPASTAHSTGAVDCYYDDVTAILDDSGSTKSTDPNKERARAMQLFINRDLAHRRAGSLLVRAAGAQLVPPRTLTSVEFGSTGKTIHGPTQITKSAAPGLIKSIFAAMKADENLTNYNAAFDQAKAANSALPRATTAGGTSIGPPNAVIFNTDGGHNVGIYANGHRPTETHVIGLNVTPPDPPGIDPENHIARLKRIASETGGSFDDVKDPVDLNLAMNRVFNSLSCLQAPQEKTKKLHKVDPGKTFKLMTYPVKKAKVIHVLVALKPQFKKLDITDFKFLLERHLVTSKARAVSTAAREDCKDKKKGKSGVNISCLGTESALSLQVEVKKGKLKKALGKKLVLKVKTPKGVGFLKSSGAQITGQISQAG